MSGTTFKPTEDIRRRSPFRSPAWRWELALEHVQSGTDPEAWEDPGIRESVQFFKAHRAAKTDDLKDAVEKRWPNLCQAYAIHSQAGLARDEIQARLLCEPVEIVAAKTGHPAEVVAEYARIFYDVLDSLEAVDWLLEHAIRPYSFAKPPTEGEYWRQLAYYGGPYVLEVLINDYFGRANAERPDQHELADCLRFLVRYNLARPPRGLTVDPEIEDEACRRALEQCRRTGKRLDPMTAYHLQFLRLAAHLPKSKELQKFLPKARTRRNKQADIELSISDENAVNSAIPRANLMPPPVETFEPMPLQQTKGATSWMTDLDFLRSRLTTQQETQQRAVR